MSTVLSQKPKPLYTSFTTSKWLQYRVKMETFSWKSLGISPDQVLSDKAVMESKPGVPMDYVTGPVGNKANHYDIPPSIAFENYPNHLDLTRIGIDYTIIDGVAYLRKSSTVHGFSLEDLQKNGLGFTRDDFHHEGWIADTDRPDGTFGNGGLEYVPKPKGNGILIVGPQEKVPYSKFSAMTDVNIYVTPYMVLDPEDITSEGELDINTVGKRFSQNANVNGHVKNFLFLDYMTRVPGYDPETGQYSNLNELSSDEVKEFAAAGMDKVRYVKGIGSADLSQLQVPANAATLYKSFLVLSTDLYDTASKLAEAKGFTGTKARDFIQEYINYVIGHEVGHFLEKDGLPEQVSEIGISSTQERIYGEQAELREGTWEGQLFGIISRIAGEYAENKRSGRRVSSTLFSKLESVANKYARKARLSGKNEKEVEEYVTGKLEEHVKEVRGSDESDLEEIVENKETDSGENAENYENESYEQGGEDGQEETEGSDGGQEAA